MDYFLDKQYYGKIGFGKRLLLHLVCKPGTKKMYPPPPSHKKSLMVKAREENIFLTKIYFKFHLD